MAVVVLAAVASLPSAALAAPEEIRGSSGSPAAPARSDLQTEVLSPARTLNEERDLHLGPRPRLIEPAATTTDHTRLGLSAWIVRGAPFERHENPGRGRARLHDRLASAGSAGGAVPSGPVRRAASTLIALGAALAAWGAGSGVIAPEPAPPPLTLRFVTFNLLHGGIFSELTGDDQALEERLRMTVEGLRVLDADVVGLQEASVGRRRGNVTARLAEALGYRHHAHAPAATRPFGSEHMRRGVASVLALAEGPALLSRFPIARWAAYELPCCGRPFDVRVLLQAELETPVGRLAVLSAHTSGDPCHTRAVADLVAAHRGPLPVIVMGDFNAADTSPAVWLLTGQGGLVDAFRHANPTAPGFTDGQDVEAGRATAGARIDYVFLAPGARIPGRVVQSRVVLHEPRRAGRVRWPSDHYGVLADVAFARPAGSGGESHRADVPRLDAGG